MCAILRQHAARAAQGERPAHQMGERHKKPFVLSPVEAWAVLFCINCGFQVYITKRPKPRFALRLGAAKRNIGKLVSLRRIRQKLP